MARPPSFNSGQGHFRAIAGHTAASSGCLKTAQHRVEEEYFRSSAQLRGAVLDQCCEQPQADGAASWRGDGIALELGRQPIELARSRSGASIAHGPNLVGAAEGVGDGAGPLWLDSFAASQLIDVGACDYGVRGPDDPMLFLHV